MACQSLDNDEILNVRWATEDPNPVQKVAEKHRLEEMGQEAIRARMDPRIVDAMRSVRALEEGDITAEGEGEADEEGEREGKRRRLEYEQEAEEMLKEMEEEDAVEAQSTPSIVPQAQGPRGLLSTDTLEGLRYFAQIRQNNGAAPASAPTSKPKAARPATLDLGGYGSDEDE